MGQHKELELGVSLMQQDMKGLSPLERAPELLQVLMPVPSASR